MTGVEPDVRRADDERVRRESVILRKCTGVAIAKLNEVGVEGGRPAECQGSPLADLAPGLRARRTPEAAGVPELIGVRRAYERCVY